MWNMFYLKFLNLFIRENLISFFVLRMEFLIFNGIFFKIRICFLISRCLFFFIMIKRKIEVFMNWSLFLYIENYLFLLVECLGNEFGKLLR